ncbi:MAG: 30S ribosomal protein S2 [Pelagibacterales bacterium]|nr:30S ribosomal protein S2 [Pelagibacterales bacterium]
MTMPNFTMKELLEAGIHFGHQKNRWNPKMEPYLFGERNGIHIIDLQQTFPLINTALKVLRDVGANGGRVLFVGTKRQAQSILAETAISSGQYYMNHRWLGGTLTNWKTISKSIVRLKSYDDILKKEDTGLTKKELVGIEKQRTKLEASLGGIKDMGGLPDALFVIDTNKEQIAITEANTLKIPVIAILDSNSNPDGVDFPIPGNDDATRSIALYCKLASEAILDGLQATFSAAGKDLGASEEIKESKTVIKPKGIDSVVSEKTDTLVKPKVKDLDASKEIKEVKASVKPDEILDKKNVKVSDETVPNNASEVVSLEDKAKS